MSYIISQDGGFYGQKSDLASAIDLAEVLLGGATEETTFTVESASGHLMAALTNRRITGLFTKQAWGGKKNKTAMFVSNEEFDATDHILSMQLEKLVEVKDDDQTSDKIGESHIKWDGPFRVEIEESICSYFGVDDVTQITKEALEFALLHQKSSVENGEKKAEFSLNQYIKDHGRGMLIPAPAEVMSLLEATTDNMPNDFFESVRMLTRPYLQITPEQYLEIQSVTQGEGDILMLGGVKVTFGSCGSDKFALMPLTQSLSAQRKKEEVPVSSRALAEQFPNKGSMPSDVVVKLYATRARELAELSKKEVIDPADLASLDRGARCLVANTLFIKCNQAGRNALLNDSHHTVRACAEIAAQEIQAL